MISELDIAVRGERAIEWLQARGAQVLESDGEVKIFADIAKSPTIVVGRIWFSPMSVEVAPVPRERTNLVFLSFAMRGTSPKIGQNEKTVGTPPPFFVHSMSEPIRIDTREASTRLVFGIRSSRLTAVLGPDHASSGPRTANAHLRKVLTSAAMASLDSPIDGDNAGFPAWRSAMENLVIAVLQSSMGRTPEQNGPASLLLRAQSIIAEQAHDASFTVLDLGRQLDISQSHLHRIFRVIGTTPAKLLRETRLSLAEEYLGTGTPTAEDLRAAAAYAGFRNLRMFRRATADERWGRDGQ